MPSATRRPRNSPQELNGKYRFEATLTSQLGVLPSYTALGMASLLPHKTLAYKANGDVLVDGKPTSSTERAGRDPAGRGRHGLQGGRPAGDEEGRGPGVRQGQAGRLHLPQRRRCGRRRRHRPRRRPSRRCGRPSTNWRPWSCYIINKLNGSHVVVTADHGFLFTESPPGETEKSKLDEKPAGTVMAKKRYLIGHDLPDHEAAWHGKTKRDGGGRGRHGVLDSPGRQPLPLHRAAHGSSTAGPCPRRSSCPSSPSEHVEGKSAKETKTKPVTVHVLGSNHKITTNRHRFQLIQMEPVSERVKAVTLKVAVYEGDEPVTNVETVTFDSASENMDERKKWVPWCCRTATTTRRRRTASCCGTPRPASSSRACRS